MSRERRPAAAAIASVHVQVSRRRLAIRQRGSVAAPWRARRRRCTALGRPFPAAAATATVAAAAAAAATAATRHLISVGLWWTAPIDAAAVGTPLPLAGSVEPRWWRRCAHAAAARAWAAISLHDSCSAVGSATPRGRRMAAATVSVVAATVVRRRMVGERAARRRSWLPPVVARRRLVMMKWMLWPSLIVAVAMRPWWRLPRRWRTTRRRRRPGLPSAVPRGHGPHSVCVPSDAGMHTSFAVWRCVRGKEQEAMRRRHDGGSVSCYLVHTSQFAVTKDNGK